MVFVVSGEEDDGGVVPEAPNLVVRFGGYGCEDGGVGWVVCAGEHEVLPDEDAEFVASVVKCVMFVDPATPYSVRRSADVL